MGISFDVPPYDEALDWAVKYGSKMITKMDKETKQRIAAEVRDSVERGDPLPDLAKTIRTTIEDMTRYRSMLISRTETANALSVGSLSTAVQMNATHKEWVAEPDCCEICADNMSEGLIPIEDSFQSGDDCPPAHPNCRCALAYSYEETQVEYDDAEAGNYVADLGKEYGTVDIENASVKHVNEGISSRASKTVAETYEALPVGYKSGIDKITCIANKGEFMQIGNHSGHVQGFYDADSKAIEIFNANNIGKDEIKNIIGHEAGHGVWSRLPMKFKEDFIKASEREGGITEYAEAWLSKKSILGGTNYAGGSENFAEYSKMFTLGNRKAGMGMHPDSYRLARKAWDAMSGVRR
jgi:hypothetical protein